MMTGIDHHPTMKPIWMISAIFALILMANAGCSLAKDQILPANLEGRISSSNGTADDHLAAARIYQQEVQQLETEAAAYARQGESITPLEDPKGFRRSALKMAAQERQRQANDMFQLVTEHRRKAETMTATHTQQ
jgi:hypothetical protein